MSQTYSRNELNVRESSPPLMPCLPDRQNPVPSHTPPRLIPFDELSAVVHPWLNAERPYRASRWEEDPAFVSRFDG